MEVLFEQEALERPIDLESLKALARFVLAEQGAPEGSELSVSFVASERIAELNERYRHKAGPTDVLSFESDGLDHPGILGRDYRIDDETPFTLGDVIIAVDVADRQRAEFGTSLDEELEILLIHGICHLFGYDHIEDDEAKLMEAREDELLARWKERS